MFSTLKNRAMVYGLIVILSIFIANVEPYFSTENINDYIEKARQEYQQAMEMYETITAGMAKDKNGIISDEYANILLKSDLSAEQKRALALGIYIWKHNLVLPDDSSQKKLYQQKIRDKAEQNMINGARMVIFLMLAILLLDVIIIGINKINISTVNIPTVNFTKSNTVLLITGSIVWLLTVYSFWADASWNNFKKGMVIFGFIPTILVNGWFFFKYFKNNDR